ncbi:MAG: DUF2892 domain-containing protein [Candidatus Aminicenantales bacterium]
MKIKKNVGLIDRTLRLIAGPALVLAGAMLMKWNIPVMAIGLVMTAVGLIGFCPIYVPFRISTRKRGSPAAKDGATTSARRRIL